MATKDLAAKYGKNKNSRVNINAAIRAELPGGNEALEALELADGLQGMARGTAFSRLLDSVYAVAAAMRADIRKRYGMPPEGSAGDDDDPPGPSAPSP